MMVGIIIFLNHKLSRGVAFFRGLEKLTEAQFKKRKIAYFSVPTELYHGFPASRIQYEIFIPADDGVSFLYLTVLVCLFLGPLLLLLKLIFREKKTFGS